MSIVVLFYLLFSFICLLRAFSGLRFRLVIDFKQHMVKRFLTLNSNVPQKGLLFAV